MKTFVRSAPPATAADTPRFVMDEGEAVDFVKQKLEEGNRARAEAMELAHTNSLRFDGSRGKQWGKWSQKLGSIIYPETDPPWRVYRTINLTQPTVVTMWSMLAAQNPQWQFSPVTTGYSSENAGGDAERLLRWVYESQALDVKRLETILFTILHGNCFWKVLYDPDKGDPVVDPDTGQKVFPGRVTIDLVPMYEVLTDAGTTDIVTPTGEPAAEWVAHQQFLSAGGVVRRYPQMAGRLSAKSPREIGNVRFERAMSSDGPRDTSSLYKLVDLYHAPTEDDEHGFTIITCDDQFVAGGELPYHRATHGEVVFPLVHFPSHLHVPGSIWRLSPIEAMKGLQSTFNEMWSALEEYVRRMPRGLAIVDEGSVRNPEDIFSSEAGGIIQVDPNARDPRLHAMIPLAPAAWEPFGVIQSLIGQMTMVREASRGEAGTNQRTALQQLSARQVDMSVLGPLSRCLEVSEERAIRMAFSLLAAFGAEGEQLRVRGPDGGFDEFEFQRDVASDVRGMFIEPGTSAPQDPMLQQTATLQAVEAGIKTPEEARRELGLVFEKGNPRGLPALNRRLAKANIRQLLRGEPVVVRPFWLHDIHLDELNRVRLLPEYLDATPQVQGLIDATAAEHQRYIEEAAMAAAGPVPAGPPGAAAPQQAASRGTPPNPTGPPSRTGVGPSLPTTAGLRNATTPPVVRLGS